MDQLTEVVTRTKTISPDGVFTYKETLKPGSHSCNFQPAELIGSKENGHIIIKGLFINKKHKAAVALKRYENSAEKAPIKTAQRDLDVLNCPEYQHPNIIRYFGSATEESFTYIATELCECSVADIFEAKIIKSPSDILDYLPHKEILRQSTEGVSFLHSLGFIHRNLHPNNFLIARVLAERHYIVKLSDFHCSKNWQVDGQNSIIRGTGEWVAPENQIGGLNLKPSLDVFILGCYFYYVLSGGKHPFGGISHRKANIIDSKHEVYADEWEGSEAWQKIPIADGKSQAFSKPNEKANALNLIKTMIKFKRIDRKSLDEVLEHEYFQPNQPYDLYSQMEKVKPGLCVIVSQELFVWPQYDRHGSEKDASLLWETFSNFGFEMRMYKNLGAKELEKILKQLSKEDFSNYASLVVCILSHGEQGTVFGIDFGKVSIHNLKLAFNGDKCPGLIGKPKIFIIQACQGHDQQKAFSQIITSDKARADVSGDAKVIKSVPKNQGRGQLPPSIDFLSLMATIEGYVSFRVKHWGSYFIQRLCNHLNSEYTTPITGEGESSKRDLYELFQSEVLPHVAFEDILVKVSKSENGFEHFKQTPEWRSTLRKTIKFRCVSNQNIPSQEEIALDGFNQPGTDFKAMRVENEKMKDIQC